MSSETSAERLKAFKAYDIRGPVPEQLNEDMVECLGMAFAKTVHPETVAIGRDVRPSSPRLAAALARGLNRGGVDVLDIGLCGTEEIYFATGYLGLGGGFMVTASHNPAGYNGVKIVREGVQPVGAESGLMELEQQVRAGAVFEALTPGQTRSWDVRPDYVRTLLDAIDVGALRPLRIVVNAGNGCAGPVLDALAPHLPIEMIKLHHEPDGSFPNGIPNPLLPEKRSVTASAVREHGADLGLAWDGDFDRCFFFDENGRFIEGYYIVGLVAAQLLASEPGARSVHDPRVVWNTIAQVTEAGGVPVCARSGHAFIKQKMREQDAMYGGEMSAHHYFRDFWYCDSGMLPWLLIIEQLSATQSPLSALLDARIQAFPTSGEINRTVRDADAVLAAVVERYASTAAHIDRLDGVSMTFANWRFNLRRSNTEPLIRLNVESRGDGALMQQQTAEILAFIDEVG